MVKIHEYVDKYGDKVREPYESKGINESDEAKFLELLEIKHNKVADRIQKMKLSPNYRHSIITVKL